MAIVEYDGTDYHGFEIQANAPTVQGALQRALTRVTQEHIAIRYAGRTDAGVHAIGQVIDFHTGWRRSLEELQRALNAVLPSDVAVRELRPAPPGFHARYSARSRVYRYSIWNHPVRSPLHRRTYAHIPHPLDEARIAVAAEVLKGTHDFRAFGAPMQPGGSTVRTLMRLDVERQGHEVFIEIEANAFLRRMVRRVVAALVEVGCGRLDADALKEILDSRDPARLKGLAPPEGLCLVKVRYGSFLRKSS